MSRLDQDREDLIRLIISICDFARFGYNVSTYNNCNNCGVFDNCEHKPKLGQNRWNCPLWKSGEAVEQLKQIGKGLGEVMDDVVPVVFCKDCKFYTSMRPDIKTGICDLNVHHMGDDGFCSEGERRT